MQNICYLVPNVVAVWLSALDSDLKPGNLGALAFPILFVGSWKIPKNRSAPQLDCCQIKQEDNRTVLFLNEH
jgi:hypothetical protein